MAVLAISAVTASACGSPPAQTRSAPHSPSAAPPISVVRDAGTGQPVWDIALAAPRRAVAALSDGLDTSANAGHSWTVSQPSSFLVPASLDLVSGQVVFAAEHGKVFRTVDGGRTWQSLRPPSARTYAVDFWTANAGVAMVPDRTGPSSGYFVTRDGARNWQRFRVPGWSLLGGGVPATPGGDLVQSSVCFAPGGTGWAVASRAGGVSVLVSPDGGRRWRVAIPARLLPRVSPALPATYPVAVAGCTGHAVWAVVTQWDQYGRMRAIDLLHTVNLGRSWLDVARSFFRFSGVHPLAVPAPPGGPTTLPTALNHIAWLTAPGPSAAWLGLTDSQGLAEGYAATGNGGLTWRLRSFPGSGVCPPPARSATGLPAQHYLVALTALSARVAWMVLAAKINAAPAYLYGTANGGATWTAITRFGTSSQQRLPRTGTCSAGG